MYIKVVEIRYEFFIDFFQSYYMYNIYGSQTYIFVRKSAFYVSKLVVCGFQEAECSCRFAANLM